MYLTYDEYLAYGGKLENADFDRFRFRAEREIDNATFEKIKALSKIPENVKRCVFELIIFLSENAKLGNMRTISGVSNDGYSVSYSENKTGNEVEEIIRTYLLNTGLMYCGVE